VPWKFVEKLFFNKGLISGLILLDRETSKTCLQTNNVQFFFTNICLDEKNGLPRFLATIVNLPNIAGGLNDLEKKLDTIANLDTNQDTTL
jgi:hypothetical protein